MKISPLAFLIAALSSTAAATDGTENHGHPMNCAAERPISTQEILGAWYFTLGETGPWKMELRADGRFSVAVFASDRHSEADPMGGKWNLNNGVLELIWADGTAKRDQIVSLTDCELNTASAEKGVKSYYYRKPVWPTAAPASQAQQNCTTPSNRP